jgi:hypothetical protein
MKYRNQKGSVLLLMVITIPFLFALSALAVDIGSLYSQRAHMQNIADAAALAGASQLSIGQTEAEEMAEVYVARNSTSADAGHTVAVTFPSGNERIRVEISQAVPLIFMRYFNYMNLDLAVHAVASYSGSSASIFDYSIISGGEETFYLLGYNGSGSNTFNGPIHANGELQFDKVVNNPGDFTSNTIDAPISTAKENYVINAFKQSANKNKFESKVTYGADTIDITDNNPIISNYISSLKQNAIEMHPSAIGNNRTLSSLGEKVYIRGAFDNNGSNYVLGWEPSYNGTFVIIADGNIKLQFSTNDISNAKIILCSLEGDIEINTYHPKLTISALAPKGNIKMSAGAVIDGFLIGQSITLGNGGRTYQNSRWAGSGSGSGGGTPKIRLIE